MKHVLNPKKDTYPHGKMKLTHLKDENGNDCGGLVDIYVDRSTFILIKCQKCGGDGVIKIESPSRG